MDKIVNFNRRNRKYYVDELRPVLNEHPYSFYVWFKNVLDQLGPEYNKYINIIRNVEYGIENHENQSRQFVFAWNNLLRIFNQFYNVRSVYYNCFGRINVYMSENWQYNGIQRLFNFHNKDKKGILIPAPYVIRIVLNKGKFVLADDSVKPKDMEAPIKSINAKGKDAIFMFSIDTNESDNHMNLLIFKPNNTAVLIEPNLEEGEISNLDTENKEILNCVSLFCAKFFSTYKFLGYETELCTHLSSHYNMCAPMSIIHYLFTGEDLEFVDIEYDIRKFIEYEFEQLNNFYQELVYNISQLKPDSFVVDDIDLTTIFPEISQASGSALTTRSNITPSLLEELKERHTPFIPLKPFPEEPDMSETSESAFGKLNKLKKLKELIREINYLKSN